MKLTSLFALLIIFATSTLAQHDTNAYKNEIRKEIKSIEETVFQLKDKTSQLEQARLSNDTLIDALKRQRVEITTELAITEQVYRDLLYTSKELTDLIKGYQKQEKETSTRLNRKPSHLSKMERDRQKKDLADIRRSLAEERLRNDSIQKDIKRVIARIEQRKKKLASGDKELDRIIENKKAMELHLDEARRLIAGLEKQILAMKEELLDK